MILSMIFGIGVLGLGACFSQPITPEQQALIIQMVHGQHCRRGATERACELHHVLRFRISVHNVSVNWSRGLFRVWAFAPICWISLVTWDAGTTLSRLTPFVSSLMPQDLTKGKVVNFDDLIPPHRPPARAEPRKIWRTRCTARRWNAHAVFRDTLDSEWFQRTAVAKPLWKIVYFGVIRTTQQGWGVARV